MLNWPYIADSHCGSAQNRYTSLPMGFCLSDLDDDANVLFVNFWNWRPTVELIGSFELIEPERLELLQTQASFVQISRSEADEIFQRLTKEVLPSLPPEARIKLDGSTTSEVDDGTFHKGEGEDKNYGASRSWLEKFAEFCASCNGFSVS